MDRKLLFVVTMTSLTMIAFHYWSYKSPSQQQEQAASGQSFRIPSQEEMLKPLNREIDFSDGKVTEAEEKIEIESDLYLVNFSSHGGMVSSVDFKKRTGKYKTPLRTITPKDFFVREEGSFLLALNEKTPYFYKQISSYDDMQARRVVYETETQDWKITKTYSIEKGSYSIDVSLDFEPKRKDVEPIQPRLFLSGPFIAELDGDTLSGFTFNSKTQKIEKSSGVLELETAWMTPEVFGVEDRYFAHALIKDKDHFAQRGYYKKVGTHQLISIIEGPYLKEKTHFDMSFYIGPKDIGDLAAVDVRLEGLVDTMWFLSWLYKLLLRLLEWLNSFLGNYGLAIIALAILIKIPFLPLSIKGAEAMEKMQKYQPHLARIKAQFKGDSQRQHEEMMLFYKEKGISPAGQFVGCLPLMIDIPIMMTLYKMLGNYLDLYHSPFLLWITDLSAKDPYYVLPIVMGLTMVWQQRMTPVTDDRQRVILGVIMPLFITGIFSGMASGLVLYWTMKNILMVGETYLRKSILKR
jgi:YidC/Oxa1 family membrane protein insertase